MNPAVAGGKVTKQRRLLAGNVNQVVGAQRGLDPQCVQGTSGHELARFP